MKNAYLTSHFPLFSIILFSLSLSMYSEKQISFYLKEIGLYEGMIEFFSENGIRLSILFLLWLFFFMLFAALKLIANTINEVSLLFFSKDEEGGDLNKVRGGSWIFLIAGVVSIVTVLQLYITLAVLLAACIVYFIYFIYKVSYSLSAPALIGMIFFHMFFWFSFILAVAYTFLKLYNSMIASLPL
ncbi:hypothetical protein SAMN05421736_107146 [Evansella caseinilytica]|uniref:YufK family protein n=1 Tax=Evansella caseinilytica TaxID=1503961 RepID=A0A1H3R1F1_9BACI|nr:DUF5366 family protein [Evansella caseinilytica]SDZ19440.1 hypothetical protein SAMN05421736_107146 [Evansella caseinilytica]